jgi:hypothetical protein
MSNERRHQGDPRVSRVYREFSDERTPEHLDHVVLNEARRAAKPGYVRTISWLRPAAWVTTIGLCLAIVLEVTDMVPPEPSAPPAEAEQEPVASEKPAVPAPATGWTPTSATEPESSVRERSDSAQKQKLENVADTARDGPDTSAGRSEAGSAEAVPAATPQPVNAKRRGPPVAEAEAFDQEDRQLLHEAEERARMQTGSDQDSVDSLMQAAPPIGLTSVPAQERYCNEDQTADPNTWLACILELEQQGLLEAAKIERDLLRESFPDVPSLIDR